MTVGELRNALSIMDDCAEVFIERNMPYDRRRVLQVSTSPRCITLHDVNIIRERRRVRAFNGVTYEVPWK